MERTVFSRAGVGAIVVLASWAPRTCSVKLEAPGLGAAKLLSPRVPGLQCGFPSRSSLEVEVAANAGALLLVHGSRLDVSGLVPREPCRTLKPMARASPPRRPASGRPAPVHREVPFQRRRRFPEM